MNETNTSIKKEDEIYCPNCAKLIKKDFTLCPYCRTEIKKLINIEPEISQNKSKENVDNKPISETYKISNNTNNTQDEKISNAGKSMQDIGCLLTIFITIPIILIVIFLVMCGRS